MEDARGGEVESMRGGGGGGAGGGAPILEWSYVPIVLFLAAWQETQLFLTCIFYYCSSRPCSHS